MDVTRSERSSRQAVPMTRRRALRVLGGGLALAGAFRYSGSVQGRIRIKNDNKNNNHNKHNNHETNSNG